MVVTNIFLAVARKISLSTQVWYLAVFCSIYLRLPQKQQHPACAGFCAYNLLAVNLHGVYHGVRVFVPRLIAEGESASLLHTSSIAAFTTGAQQGAYQTSKRAVLALSECLASELVGVGAPISVTVAFPGPVATQIFDLAAPDSAESATVRTMLQKLVGKRGMQPDDAGQLLFKASVAGREWVTTDLEGLRSFLEPQRMRLDDIGAQAVGPNEP